MNKKRKIYKPDCIRNAYIILEEKIIIQNDPVIRNSKFLIDPVIRNF
ncbi:hypothetical protein AGMMS50262_01410 [Bacteroidia bacterium]|nr:hypothetical protein AGMMS50262_01410 [Bacteroidia bacterium]